MAAPMGDIWDNYDEEDYRKRRDTGRKREKALLDPARIALVHRAARVVLSTHPTMPQFRLLNHMQVLWRIWGVTAHEVPEQHDVFSMLVDPPTGFCRKNFGLELTAPDPPLTTSKSLASTVVELRALKLLHPEITTEVDHLLSLLPYLHG